MFSIMSESFDNVYSDMYDNIEKLYNKEQKIKFLKDEYGLDTEKTLKSVVNFWCNVSQYEAEKNKDVLEFGTADFIDLLNRLNIRTASSFSNRKNLILVYLQWGVRNKDYSLENVNRFIDLHFKEIIHSDRIKDKFFKNFDDLNECIQTAIKSKEKQDSYKYQVVTAILYLLWLGLTLEEIYMLQLSNIDFQNNIINYNNMQYHINSETNQYIQRHIVNAKDDNQMLLELLNDDKNITRSTMRAYISEFANIFNNIDSSDIYYEHLLYPKDISESGLFYRLFEQEKKNGIQINSISDKLLLQFGYRNESNPSMLTKLSDRYKTWRHVFYSI